MHASVSTINLGSPFLGPESLLWKALCLSEMSTAILDIQMCVALATERKGVIFHNPTLETEMKK